MIASYKAYDTYSRVASQNDAYLVNLAGVSIPVGTILKRAASDGNVEEDFLSARLLTVQMWLVYWIVNGSVAVAESVLLLRYLPLYSSLRLLFSAWLVAPIVVTSVRVRNAAHLSPADIQKEWLSFADQGCGLLYFRYLKPLFENHLSGLMNLNFEGLLNKVATFSGMAPMFSLMGPKVLALAASYFTGNQSWSASSAPGASGASGVSGTSGAPGASGASRGVSGPSGILSFWGNTHDDKSKDDVTADYDVIDTPAAGLSATETSPPESSPRNRSGWLW